jgi:TRAP-type C4-dicarboxylate transport system permease small subunit
LAVRVEDLVLSASLAAMMILPLLLILLRGLFRAQIHGQTSIVQHLTLIVAMIGAATAARDGRLLSLSSAGLLARGRWRGVGRGFAAAVAATVSALLGLASAQFVASERAAGGLLEIGRAHV